MSGTVAPTEPETCVSLAGPPDGELCDRDLEVIRAGLGKQDTTSNLPEFSKLSRLRARVLDDISIHLTEGNIPRWRL